MLSFLILFSVAAQAGEFKVLCEHYLRGHVAENAWQELDQRVFDRAFRLASRQDVSSRALRVLQVNHLDSSDLVVKLSTDHNHFDPVELKLKTALEIGQHHFPDATPIFWQPFAVDLRGAEPTFDSLTRSVWLTKAPRLANGYLGFHTDPDRRGIRIYVSAYREEGQTQLELGLDVPCDEVDEFLGRGRDVPILTSVTEYCRVKALTFRED